MRHLGRPSCVSGARSSHTLYSGKGSATLADNTVLQFTPLPDASRYRVDVETENGTTVFRWRLDCQLWCFLGHSSTGGFARRLSAARAWAVSALNVTNSAVAVSPTPSSVRTC